LKGLEREREREEMIEKVDLRVFILGLLGALRILKGKHFRYGQSVYEPSGHDKHQSEPRCN